MTVRFRPWALSLGCKPFWRCQASSPYPTMYGFSSLPSQKSFRSSETLGCKTRKNVSRKGILAALVLACCLPLAANAGDGMKYQDHWRSLGVSASDIELIDKLGMKKKKVEALVTRGVSVREYSHRPWEPMGITEEKWFFQLQNGSNISALERLYTRERDIADPDRPNLAFAILCPGIPQFKENRPVAGAILGGLGVAFLSLSVVNIIKGEGSAVQVWLPLLGVDMLASGADVWYHHYREQAVTGFSLNLAPRPAGAGVVLAARF